MSKMALILSLLVLFSLAALDLAGCGQTTSPPSSTTSGPLSITTSSLAKGQTGLNYSQTLQASGGKAPYNWAIASGSLPDGLLFSAANGIISGIPNKSGTFAFSALVSDASGAQANRSLSINIAAASQPLTSSTGSLGDGEVGVKYTQKLKVYGGDGNYTWSLADGSLPQGIALDAATGSLSGTPAAVIKSYFTVKVSDGAGAFATEALTLNINQTLTMDPSKIVEGEVGINYSCTPDAFNGVPKYIWTLTQGSLPDGLKMDPGSGNISGTPTTAGPFKFTLQLNDTAGGSVSLEIALSIFPTISLSTASLPPASLGTPYSQSLQYTGGTGEVIWANAGGTLPDGLDFDGNTGVLSGTPTKAGTFSLSFQVIDNLGSTSSHDYSLVIK